MSRRASGRVRDRREARGISQMELAAAVGLSRQSIGAIESGRSTPSVDVALRVASALGATVEELFGGTPETITAERGTGGRGARVALARVAGRWVSYPLAGMNARGAADALVRDAHRGQVEALSAVEGAAENFVLMGCAPALGLLADRLSAQKERGRVLWVQASSTRALEALGKRRTHVAGVHLVDARTGEQNVPDVARHAGDDPVALVTLARWEAGLVVAQGNPRRVRRVADLAQGGLRLVTREAGSGARRLLEREIERAQLPRRTAQGALLASGHLEVAHAVAIGAADAGIATRDAAIAFDLDFVPLAEERYDLVIPVSGLEDARVRRLLDALTSAAVRRELSSLGYDPSQSGDRVAQVRAS